MSPRRLLGGALGLAALLAALWVAPAQAAFSDYGLESVGATETTNQAGAHPDVALEFKLKTDPSTPVTGGQHEPYALTEALEFEMPPGLLGNLNAVEECPLPVFLTAFEHDTSEGCPFSTQVGFASSRVIPFSFSATGSIYLLTPPENGNTVARLGLFAGPVPLIISIHVRSNSDYGLTARLEGIPSNFPLVSSKATLWGVPADPSHDNKRFFAGEYEKTTSPPREAGIQPAPFLTNPTSCNGPLTVGFTARSYQLPGQQSTSQASLPAITGCDSVKFEPSFSVVPTNHAAEAPTGLDVALTMPQDEALGGRATAALRGARVTLPAGMAIAPGAGDGLQACSSEQAGYESTHAAECPLGAQIGTATFAVPALRSEPDGSTRVLHGRVFQRTPEKGDQFRIWLIADEAGVHVALPGDIHADPLSGQLTNVFIDTPQVPVSELHLHIKEGPRAPLATPRHCGTYQTDFQFEPWSGGPAAAAQTPMTIDEGCATGGFSPGLSGGSGNNLAGAFTPFVLNITRQAGEQNISGLEVKLPPGLLAKLGGVPLCGEAEAATGACPPGSQIGTTAVAAGPGPAPLWVPQPGKAPTAVYLAGPYKGAPYSTVVKVPAQAGPFDLGTVTVRAGLYVDPTTAQATIRTDPLPQILEGVPVTYRDIHVDVNRPNFTLNPTNCEPLAIGSTMSGSEGAIAHPADPFRVDGCANLGFKPKLKFQFRGQTKRIGHPSLKAVLTQPPGQANIGRVSVLLPKTEFIDPQHIGNVCTRVQFAANACPKRSILGTAKAWTPLLDKPLEGKVYFRSNGSERELPDIVAALRGAISVDLVGFVDSVKKKGSESSRVRNIFNTVPDAPVSKFVIELKGGKQGLLQNSRDLCKAENAVDLKMNAQNGARLESHQQVAVSCGGKGGGGGK